MQTDDRADRLAPLYLALQLAERCRSLSSSPAPVADPGERRRRWQEIPGLGDEESLARRLAAEGIGPAEFDRVLTETPEAIRDRWPETPPWLAALCDLYSSGQPADRADESNPESFLALVAPLARAGRDRVERGARELVGRFPAAPFDPDLVVPVLYADLAIRLTRRIARTAVLEMHVARLEERLAGATAEERFHDFARRLADPAVAWDLLCEYPVLARLAVQTVDQWVVVSLEFLEQLCRDAADLGALFNGGLGIGEVSEIESVAGDLHRGSRSVRLLRFSSGLRLVYKPRSLGVDRHFGELMAWLDQRRGDLPSFRVLRVLDRGGYGWIEFVDHLPCETEAEVERFYLRQGMNLALLHVLGACDFHHENLIASGEHPVLIDLESLLAPHVTRRLGGGAVERALEELASSVLSIGLLPFRAWAGNGSEGIDLSGLGSAADQMTPTAVPRWDAAGTDAMRLERRRVPLAEGKNRPTLAGARGSVSEHAQALLDGFVGMYRILIERRAELLAPGGPLDRFAGDQVRVIVRATQAYAHLLVESYHPDVLRDALERDRLFDHLWTGVSQAGEVSRVFPYERADMWRGDVPLFTTTVASRDLTTSDGERITGYFAASGMELLRERLDRASEGEVERQVWYIRAALSLIERADRHGPGARRGRRSARTHRATSAEFVAAAQAIGDRLDALAVRGDDGATWTGLMYDDHRHPFIGPLGLDLYSGLPGVTLFLAQLGGFPGGARFTALAEAAMATQLGMLDQGALPRARLGAFSGRAGLLYVLCRLSSLWGRADLRQRAEALADTLGPLVEEDDQLDVIAGAAGSIGALLVLDRLAPGGRALAIARRCGDRLLAMARPTEGGVAWPMPTAPDRMLTGFSHGTAGMAWALLGLWSVTRDDRYRAVAAGAMEHERTFFRASAGNWMDLRPPDPGEEAKPEAYMTNWCHGAPGIGLARLARLAEVDDAVVRSEIDAAIRTTVACGSGMNHSLCHGDLGNLELLIQARRTLGDTTLDEPLALGAGAVLESIRLGGWRCGWALSVETPGLMIGLAGIGYGLLRLAAADRVPSVLLLEP